MPLLGNDQTSDCGHNNIVTWERCGDESYAVA